MHGKCNYNSAFFPLKLVTPEEDRLLKLALNIKGFTAATYFEIPMWIKVDNDESLNQEKNCKALAKMLEKEEDRGPAKLLLTNKSFPFLKVSNTVSY